MTSEEIIQLVQETFFANTEWVNIGKAGFTPKNEWQNNVSYEELDVVQYEGSLYIALEDNINKNPVEYEDTVWMLAAEHGKFTAQQLEDFKSAVVAESKSEIDDYTEDKKDEIDNHVSDYEEAFNTNATNKTNAFNTNATNKTNDFNDNATSKTNTFNSNASDKTDEFDENATNQTTSFNTNATNKTGDFNDNASDKTDDFDENAETKTTAFNTNASNKTNTFNTNATNKTADFDTNASTKTDDFNTNATNKTSSFNTNVTNKTNAFDEHVEDKTDEFDEHADSIQQDVNTLKEDVSDLKERTEVIESKVGKVYGVRRAKSNNTSPVWERIMDSVGLEANATHDGTAVTNDFDSLYPWSDIISFNLDLTTGEKTAYYGDADFKFDGSNGDVYTQIPRFWIKVYEENNYDYVLIADYPKKGFTEIKEFAIQRYLTGIGQDGKLHSYSRLAGADFRNINSYRTMAKALGEDYCLMDWRYFAIQYLYLVEYATFNSQSALGNGCSSMRHNTNDKALIAETNANRFIVNTTAGNAFVVGQQVKIGTFENSNSATRTITAIADYDDGTITGKEITFDGDPLNITTSSVIWTGVQSAGQCDSLGMKSGCLIDDQKHNVIYRGIEGIFANIFAFVDGINIKNRVPWICYDPAEYVSDKFEAPYQQLGYTNASSNGYGKTLGFDSDHPLFKFPTEIGGGTSTGTTDYYYQDAGNRVARVGGTSNSGAYCGLWCWYLSGTSSAAYWICGARVLKYQ